jgi:hypothetical protein
MSADDFGPIPESGFMSTVLTCDCGARFEVDALVLGNSVNCPECHQTLQANPREKPPPRLSWLALLSVALALAGAFTIIGSLAAVLLGVVALKHLRASPERIQGRGFALLGIGLGLGATVVTGWFLFQRDRFPIGAWLRQRALTAQLDRNALREAVTSDTVCLIKLPSSDWHKLKGGTSGDPAIDDLQAKRDMVFVNFKWPAYLDLARDTPGKGVDFNLYRDTLYRDLAPPRPALIGDDEEVPSDERSPKILPRLVKDNAVVPIDGYEGYEWQFDLQRGGQTWRVLVRAYREAGGKDARSNVFYIVRLYAPRSRFLAHEEELREFLDQARFLR